MSIPTESARTPAWPGSALTSGEALGLLVAPFAAALVCALPVLISGSPSNAAALAALYLVVLGVAPNFAIGRRLLASTRSRGAQRLRLSMAGGALIKVAVVLLLTVVGPPILLGLDRQDHIASRWAGMAQVGAWACPIAALLGGLEGAVFWIVVRTVHARARRIPAVDRNGAPPSDTPEAEY